MFLRKITLISLTGPPIVLISTSTSMSGIVWTDDWGVVPTHPLTWTNFVMHSGRNQHFSPFHAPAMHCSGQFKRWTYPLLSVFFHYVFFLTRTTLGQNFSKFVNLLPWFIRNWYLCFYQSHKVATVTSLHSLHCLSNRYHVLFKQLMALNQLKVLFLFNGFVSYTSWRWCNVRYIKSYIETTT